VAHARQSIVGCWLEQFQGWADARRAIAAGRIVASSYKVRGFNADDTHPLFLVPVIKELANTTEKDGKVFAANYEGEAVIKRLRRNAGQWRLYSDNPDQARHPPKLCTEDVRLTGRVVYKQSEEI
jgi:hypothetical protein